MPAPRSKKNVTVLKYKKCAINIKNKIRNKKIKLYCTTKNLENTTQEQGINTTNLPQKPNKLPKSEQTSSNKMKQ